MTDTLRIVVGSDDAGYEYKTALKALLESDPRVAAVADVGVAGDEHTDYPHVAVEAARRVAAGEADRADGANLHRRVRPFLDLPRIVTGGRLAHGAGRLRHRAPRHR